MRLVVLDMAGTTVDERNVVYRVMTEALVAAGVEIGLDEVVALGAGLEKRAALGGILALKGAGDASEARVDAVFKAFEARLDAAYASLEVRSVAGAEAVFGSLRAAGLKVVLNTGYARRVAEGLLARLGWRVGAEIHGLVTADDVGRSRPDPAMIHAAMAAFGVDDARDVAKVGDTVADVLEGRNAGCGLSIGVTTGAQTREALAEARPDAIIDSLSELLPLVGVSGR